MHFSQGCLHFNAGCFTLGFLGSGWSVENLSWGFGHTQRNSLLISSLCQIRKIHTLTLGDPIRSQGFHSTDTNAGAAGNDRYVGKFFQLLSGERFVKHNGVYNVEIYNIIINAHFHFNPCRSLGYYIQCSHFEI